MNPFWKVVGRFQPYFRARRVGRFLEQFKPTARTRILDVGGTPQFWNTATDAQITLVNIKPLEDYERAYLRPNMKAVVGDGTRLQFEDQEFDIVFSNSVIEHLGTVEKQRAFASEVRRVGKAYWIQTPAYEFPIEPHFLTPFVHWLPRRVRRHLLRNFTVWGLMGRPNDLVVEMTLDEIRLLRFVEFQALFPESDIWIERALGLPKSYTAFKLPVPAIAAPQPVVERKRELAAAAA
jgi:hypothetical protein